MDRLDSESERFRRLVDDHYVAVLAYALRRTDSPEDAQDVVSETFLVAWRRRARVPSGEGERAWLLAVARRVLSNQRRSSGRRQRLAEKLQHTAAPPAASETGVDATLLVALGRLRRADQEILRLRVWDGLTNDEIATVLGLRASAVAVRLSRARARLRRAAEQLEAGTRTQPERNVETEERATRP